jgi:hypothetical protein
VPHTLCPNPPNQKYSEDEEESEGEDEGDDAGEGDEDDEEESEGEDEGDDDGEGDEDEGSGYSQSRQEFSLPLPITVTETSLPSNAKFQRKVSNRIPQAYEEEGPSSQISNSGQSHEAYPDSEDLLAGHEDSTMDPLATE